MAARMITRSQAVSASVGVAALLAAAGCSSPETPSAATDQFVDEAGVTNEYDAVVAEARVAAGLDATSPLGRDGGCVIPGGSRRVGRGHGVELRVGSSVAGCTTERPRGRRAGLDDVCLDRRPPRVSGVLRSRRARHRPFEGLSRTPNSKFSGVENDVSANCPADAS